MRLLVDGVFFQLNNTGIARVWRSLLPKLVKRLGGEVILLDRGNAPLIEGVTLVPFPSRRLAEQSPDDSIMLQRLCDHYSADVFSSTYYTSPLSTPMLLMVYDMIPELFEFDLTQRPWMDKELAISFAQRHLCISHSTRYDLLSFYPELDPAQVAVAWCGIDDLVFKPQEDAAVTEFRRNYDLERPYYLLVGSRTQHNGYKNGRLFFDALRGMSSCDFDVLCVGGEPVIEDDLLRCVPPGVRCRHVRLTDIELAQAYGGATALVYPSLYEGFGMPVIEAMAVGCPVVTTHHGSLREAAGNAACLISGYSADEMRAALGRVTDPIERQELCQRGYAHARQFCWESMADTFCRQAHDLVQENRQGRYADFFEEWRRLREVQACVDF